MPRFARNDGHVELIGVSPKFLATEAQKIQEGASGKRISIASNGTKIMPSSSNLILSTDFPSTSSKAQLAPGETGRCFLLFTLHYSCKLATRLKDGL
ncbi:MAG: hypothetical protein ACYC0P_14455, partial [Thiobacillus sp.]